MFQEVDYEGPTARKAVASRDWHLIENVVPDGTFELYHLATDPDEEHDLYVRGAGGEQRRLEAALAEWEDEIALPRDFATRVAGNLSTAPLPWAEPLDTELRIGGRTILVVAGVSVGANAVRAGEATELSLVFRTEARVPPGWRLFTHASHPSGGGFLNLDHEPVEGFVPLARLRPGQWVRDRIRFAVPSSWPPGPLTIEVGLFKGRERAEARGPAAVGDLVRAATVMVRR